jgi:ubiquinone/menaquinone biosynthesis C-methylase UbiE
MGISEQAFWNFYARLYDTLGTTIPYRQLHKEIAGCLKDIQSKHARVLDAGCGTGHQLHLVRARHPEWRLAGIDRSEAMLHVAARKLREDNVVLQLGDLSKTLPFNDETFDAVISTNVLYTLPDPQAHLRDLRRILKKGGTLVLVNPWNPKPHLIFVDHMQRVFARRRSDEIALTLLRMPSYVSILLLNLVIALKGGTKTYTFPSVEGLDRQLSACGFTVKEIRDNIYTGTCALLHARAI